MERNLLLGKLEQKYNPDVVNKFEEMKMNRDKEIKVEKNYTLERSINPRSNQSVKPDLVEKKRLSEDEQFKRIFSQSNYNKNKLIYERREQQVQNLASKIQIQDYNELKSNYT